MLSAEKAREMSEKSRKERLKREWKKLKKKRYKAISKGEFSFKIKPLSYEAKKKLRDADYTITKDDDQQHDIVSWEQSLVS